MIHPMHQPHTVRTFIQKYAIYVIFALMIIIFAFLTKGNIIGIDNIKNIILYTTPIALIAMGVTLVIITTGIDLSSGSVLAMVAVTSATFAQASANSGDVPIIVPVAIGVLTGALAGFVNGIIITQTGIPPFIATLGMLTGARGLALVISKGNSISNLVPGYKFIGQGSIFTIPTPIWILALMVIISHIILTSTRMGRYTYAIGGNIRAAQVSGINTNRYLVLVYTYAGLLTGIAGVVTVGILNSAQPTLGVLYELDAIASSVIGGTSLSGGIGSIPGAIVGALFIGVLKNGMDLMYISAYWQQIARGLVIVFAIVLDAQKQRKQGM